VEPTSSQSPLSIGGASSASLSSGGFDSSDACTFLRAFKNVTATNSVTAMPMNTGNTCSKSTATPLSPPSFPGLRKTAFIPAFALMSSGQVQNLSSGHGFMPLYEGVSAPDVRKRFDVRINYPGDCDLHRGALFRSPGAVIRTEDAMLLAAASGVSRGEGTIRAIIC
jgi:hypothetical protein